MLIITKCGQKLQATYNFPQYFSFVVRCYCVIMTLKNIKNKLKTLKLVYWIYSMYRYVLWPISSLLMVLAYMLSHTYIFVEIITQKKMLEDWKLRFQRTRESDVCILLSLVFPVRRRARTKDYLPVSRLCVCQFGSVIVSRSGAWS